MQNVPTERVQGYLDGFKAATDVAKSVKVRVAPEIDESIQLGVDAVSGILSQQYDAFLRGEKL